ncbi:MAG: hypothetical protein MJ003_04685 [Paludibacteraceae bacterium]|nr:hypothetical protein [Paludibacteraceae bacterium]
MIDIQTIKSWFQRGMKPTAAQFAAVFDSYRHKSETLQTSDINNLDEALAEKTTANDVEAIIKEKSFPFFTLSKIDEFLWEIWYDHNNIDYDYAKQHFTNELNSHIIGGCSSVRNGNLYGRNLDWYYDNQVDFVVKTNSAKGRYASIGVASVTGITDADMLNEYDAEKFKLLPFKMVDGINEKGLICSINVVPSDMGTTNQLRGKERMPLSMVVKYILDYHSSARTALEDIRDNFDVFANAGQEVHFMCADPTGTYVLEYADNIGIVIDVSDKPVMTNFHLLNVEYNQDGTLDWSSIEDHGMGLERYDLICTMLTNGVSVKDFMPNYLKYSNAYTNENPLCWKTEFTGLTEHYGDITIHSTDEEFMPVVEIGRANYANGRNGGAWHTTHTSVYDMASLKLYVHSQEGNTERIFSLKHSQNIQSDWSETDSASDSFIKSKPAIVVSTDSDSETDVLAAKVGKNLQEEIEDLQAIGKFLSIWDCTTGLPQTNPKVSPYLYKTGDYYLIGLIGDTNYKPDGISYTAGVASSVVDTTDVAIGDMYIYDGTVWKLLLNHSRQFVVDNALSTMSTNPVQNKVITEAIATKTDKNEFTAVQTTANQALGAANNANAAAVAAQGTANTALGNANNAYALADTANGKATDAQGTANNAYTLASQVQGIANEAKGTANNANAAAVAAQGTANTALGNANNAYALADTANGKAVQADGKANSALSSLSSKFDSSKFENKLTYSETGKVPSSMSICMGIYNGVSDNSYEFYEDAVTKNSIRAPKSGVVYNAINPAPRKSQNFQGYTYDKFARAFTDGAVILSRIYYRLESTPSGYSSDWYKYQGSMTPNINDGYCVIESDGTTHMVYVTDVDTNNSYIRFNKSVGTIPSNDSWEVWFIEFGAAIGDYSHVEGYNNKALGANSHVGGCNNVSQKSNSFVHGEGLVDLMHNGAYFGKYNKDYSNWGDKPFFELAYGWNDNRQTMFMVQENSGNVFGKGSYNVMNGDYAEMFEWFDGNSDGTDRVGLFVTLNGNKIVVAKSEDEIIGVVSATPAIVGDSGAMDWKNKYLTDEWGRMLYDIDESGNRKPKLNPEYNSEEDYIPRMYRKEWSPIGLLGKLRIRHDGTLAVGGHCRCNDNGMATASDTGYIVMEVNSDNIATILVK